MLRKASAKKRRIITAGIAGALTVAIVAGVTYNAGETAFAKASLPGIEKITQSNSNSEPFKILEIVPTYDQARMGYLVAEQEPAYYNTKGVYALADMASTKEREARYPKTDADFLAASHDFYGYDELKNSAAFNWTDSFAEGDDKAKSFTVYGEFVQKDATTIQRDYIDNRNAADSYTKIGTTAITIADVLDKTNADTTGIIYDDEVVYELNNLPDGTEERYDLTLTMINDSSPKLPFRVEYPYDIDKSGTVGDSLLYDEDNYPFFDWSYYLTEDTNPYSAETTTNDNGDDVYAFTKKIPSGVALYQADSTMSIVTYYGYTTMGTDSTGEPAVCFVDKYGNIEPVEDLVTEPSLANDVANTSDLNLYTIMVYDNTKDGHSDRMAQRLYVTKAEKNTTNGCVKQTLNEKVPRVSNSQDAEQYGIDKNDPLTYHVFFYMESNISEFKFAPTDPASKFDFDQDYSKNVADTFSYEGGFTNADWFKQFVLDREPGAECKNTVVDVITKLPGDVTKDDIAQCKLIYIQGGDYSGDADMDEDVAKDLLTSVYRNNKAVAIEGYGLYDGTYDISSSVVKPGAAIGELLNNLNTLCVFLQQPRMNQIDIEDYINAWGDSAKVDTYRAKRVDDTLGKSYTINTVFVYNDNTLSGVSHIVTDKFNTSLRKEDVITTDGIKLGYKAVIDEIENEKFYLRVSKSDAEFNDRVSIATCIRHILNFGDRRVTSKSNLRILDIEPFYSQVMEDNTDLFGSKFYKKNGDDMEIVSNVVYDVNSRDIMTKEWLMTNIGTQISDADDITIKGMGTREFIGNIDDLNSKYDLIYIGLDTQYLNTDFVTTGGVTKKGTSTKYNKSGLDGLVYTHIGDELTAAKEYQGGNMATTGTFRMSGNDITFEKLRELKAYVEAGYAVLLSDGFYTYKADGTVDSVNSGLVDSNSYLYDFAAWAKEKGYLGKNVSVKKNFDGTDDKTTTGETILKNKEEFSKYLNISKLYVDTEFDGYRVPAPYFTLDENNQIKYQYIGMNYDGIYTLDYTIRLVNDAATDRDETSYDCKLYIDHDADGRFEDPVEALNGLYIVDSDGNPARFEDGVYKLTTDRTYNISRAVPEGYVGFLPWKLVFYQNGRTFQVEDDDSVNNLVRTSIQGYSAVPDFNTRPTIKVLQIFSGNGTYANGGKNSNLDLNDSTMIDLYKQVKDFNITIDQISARDYIVNDNGSYSGSPIEFLMQYDMVVMGFDDVFDFWDVQNNNNSQASSDKAIHAIRQYILSGRSMLFTHDLNSTYTTRNPWGYLANRYLRDVQGMDRYGLTKDHLSELENRFGAFVAEYKSKYDDGDRSKSNGQLVDSSGWNTSTLLRYHFANDGVTPNGYGDVSLFDANGIAHQDANFPEYTSTTITRVNQGQITEYPFHIDEQIEVARTHPQYFQLNMDTDTMDDNWDDDVVVWYTISNQNDTAALQKSGTDKDSTADKKVNYFTADYNDVRNNYYIYNKGNITYTGSGHSEITGDAEKKLFVNTLVAAYNAGDHAPYAKYKESGKNNAVDIKAMYEPYDIDLLKGTNTVGGFLENEITVYFKVVNNNLQNNTTKQEDGTYVYKPIFAQYYIPTDSATNAVQIGTKTVLNADGTTSVVPAYYKIIAPRSFKKTVDSNNNNLTPYEDKGAYTLDNYCTYEVKFSLADIISLTNGEQDSNGKTKLNLPVHNSRICIRLSMDTSTAEMSTNTEVLKATDSLEPLDINFSELYELE